LKRLILTAFAIASVAAPMAAVATDAAAQGRDRYERRDDYRRDDRREWRGDRYDRRDERRDERRGYRNNRWDDRRYNGYYYNNRWTYGAPPARYYGSPAYRPGYQAWRRGGYLPPAYRGYIVRDYGRYGLRPPPRGYYWYNVNGDYLLAAMATGLIFDIITR
jgi:Ni/Co efflux regulator RcnB